MDSSSGPLPPQAPDAVPEAPERPGSEGGAAPAAPEEGGAPGSGSTHPDGTLIDMFDLGLNVTTGRRAFDFESAQRGPDYMAWFEAVYGYKEFNTDRHRTRDITEMWRKNQECFTVECHETYPFGLASRPDEYAILRSTMEDGLTLGAGEFHERGVPELREIILEQNALGVGRGQIDVRHQVVNDVRRLHGLAARHCKQDKRAMIQAASQFNYLEMPNPGATPSFGLTRHYMCDGRVQGPRCATATAGATWLRNWYLTEGDAEEQQFNGLRAVMEVLNADGQVVWMENGYALADTQLDSDLPLPLDGDELERVVEEKLRIAFSIDAEVLTIDRPAGVPAGHRGYVANAWCSAVPWVNQRDQRKLLGLGRAVLKASYKATLLGAIAHQMDVVYLTSVGGGVWGNDVHMIADAMNAAVAEARQVGRKLEVVILHWRRLQESLTDLVDGPMTEDPIDP